LNFNYLQINRADVVPVPNAKATYWGAQAGNIAETRFPEVLPAAFYTDEWVRLA